jgi:hypothetical protein
MWRRGTGSLPTKKRDKRGLARMKRRVVDKNRSNDELAGVDWMGRRERSGKGKRDAGWSRLDKGGEGC